MSCRYYGRAAIAQLRLLVDTGGFGPPEFTGNQCAQITDRHAPCSMTIAGDAADWDRCPLNLGDNKLAGYHLAALMFTPGPRQLAVEIGGRVKISGHAGEVVGTVEADVAAEELPAIDGAPPIEIVRSICREFGYNRLLSISYDYGETPVIFLAVSRDGARWFDLRGQAIEIVPTDKKL